MKCVLCRKEKGEREKGEREKEECLYRRKKGGGFGQR